MPAPLNPQGVVAPRPVNVAVVLLNYRGATDTLACLDSLLQQQHLFWRLFVCDNRSPGDDWSLLQTGLAQRASAIAQAQARAMVSHGRDWCAVEEEAQAPTQAPDAWITLVRNRENGGFAKGNNAGLRLALLDPAVTHAWLLNNDTELPADSLAQLACAAQARPDVGLWGATVLYHQPPHRVQALGGGGMNPRTAQTWHLGAFQDLAALDSTAGAVQRVEADMAYVLGASMLANRHWLNTVGLLCEAYFLYYEELDWATRGQGLGLSLGYAPLAVVLHKEGASIGTAPDGGSALSVFHLHRSRLIYCRLHLGAGSVLLSSLQAVWQASKHLLRRRLRLVMPVLRGTWSGLVCQVLKKDQA